MITVRHAVMDLLRELDMTTVFGNPGSTELPFLDRWPNDFRYVLGLQEASVVGMADGYARATGRAAFCNLHSAVGIGHALGNVFTSFRNQAPLVITAGQQARSLLPLNPFLGATDAAAFPRPYVKWSCEPARAEDVPAAIAHAHQIAMQHPRGPTFVSIPSDDWAVPARPFPARQISQDTAPDPAALDALAAALDTCRSPVLVIGPEVDAEGAGPSAVALAEHLHAPVWASPFASRIAFPEHHALFAGFLAAAPGAVAAALAPHDLVLVLGAPVFTFHVAGEVAAPPGALFQLTTDTEALAAAPFGTGILGSLRLGLPALTTRLSPTSRPAPPPRPARPAPAVRRSGDKASMRIASSARWAVLAGLVATLAPPVRAQGPAPAAWPGRPLRIIVPFPPGGLADLLARPLAARLQQAFGQPVVVENRPGAGGNIGADLVAKSAPDGATWLLGSIGPLAVNQFLFRAMPYETRTAFAPTSLLISTPKVVVVGAGRPWRDLPALLAAARANPGTLTAGSAGNGTSLHIALALFNQQAGTDITHIPYRGAAAAVTDLVGGRIDLIIDNLPNILPQLREGAARPLAVATPGRLPQLPEVPTTAEAGLPDFLFGTWFGLAAPAGTPRAVLDRMAAEVDAALRDPAIGGRLAEQGAIPGGGTPEAFAAFIAAETARLQPVIQAAGIRAE